MGWGRSLGGLAPSTPTPLDDEPEGNGDEFAMHVEDRGPGQRPDPFVLPPPLGGRRNCLHALLGGPLSGHLERTVFALPRALAGEAVLVSLLRRLDIMVVQEAHSPDLSYVELERTVVRTHRCIWQAAEGDRPVGGLGFFVSHRLLQDFSEVSLRALGRSGRILVGGAQS